MGLCEESGGKELCLEFSGYLSGCLSISSFFPVWLCALVHAYIYIYINLYYSTCHGPWRLISWFTPSHLLICAPLFFIPKEIKESDNTIHGKVTTLQLQGMLCMKAICHFTKSWILLGLSGMPTISDSRVTVRLGHNRQSCNWYLVLSCALLLVGQLCAVHCWHRFNTTFFKFQW